MLKRRIVLLFVCVVFASMAGACGGQDGSQPQDSDSGGSGQEKQAGKEKTESKGAVKDQARDRKSMKGVVAEVVMVEGNTEKGKKSRVAVTPEEGDPVIFKFKPEIKVELNGEEAAPEDIKKGQRAEIEYITVVAPEQDVEQNIAQSIKLEAADEGENGGEDGAG